MVKCLPAMRKTQVQFMGQEDPLEREMATHSSTLAWKIPWMEEPVGYSPWGHKESDSGFTFSFLVQSCVPEAAMTNCFLRKQNLFLIYREV